MLCSGSKKRKYFVSDVDSVYFIEYCRAKNYSGLNLRARATSAFLPWKLHFCIDGFG